MKQPDQFSLLPEWPKSIPSCCPRCQQKFDIRYSLELGPGKVGRHLKRGAPLLAVFMVVLMFATKLSFLNIGGSGGAMAFAVAIILPSLLLSGLASLLPKRVRVHCFQCGNEKFHALPRELDNRISRVTE